MLSLVSFIFTLNDALIEDFSLGGAAFRSLLWALFFGTLFWVELKYAPRGDIRRAYDGNWYHSRRFHQISLVFFGVACLANIFLTFILVWSFMST